MKYSEAIIARTFIIRLEDGDIIHEQLEQFSHDHKISAGFCTVVGGIDKGSILIVGPEQGRSEKIIPVEYVFDDVCEVTGSGTLFPDTTGNPILHMHIACGRKGNTVTGCVRRGVKVWHVLEVVLREIINTTAVRKKDSVTGFELLNP